ncbi:30S ribosomal protein S17, chloroplastic [Coffea eugenioides]|uniref:Small ribosomal subunit protein uS17c n=1 Tax=Coffea arabica TaxID=13443 RepID=A0A6P6XDF7_COFAR|nr:30S ribosomal protein S17, chloroplastic [Coffea arabica]XP_027167589.1 30S ribosomal protein S17, chloroplastic [Coffea eugenioides]
MSATSAFLHVPLSQFKSLTLSTPFLHGSTPISLLSKPSSSLSNARTSPLTVLPPIRAMKSMQGRVVCATNDKTVAVEVTRLAPHPKYKRRVRKKKKYQAHDPLNQFKVGDFVQLEKGRPISKTKTFLAVPVVGRNAPKAKELVPQELGLKLESDQQNQIEGSVGT